VEKNENIKAEHEKQLIEENEYYEYLFGENGAYYSEIDSTNESDGRVDWTTTEYRIRKLVPMECYKLMDVTEKDANKMLAVNSATQCYKQAGNSIVVAVLCAIFSQLNIQGIKSWNVRTLKEKYDLVANPKAHI
jgi:DNA (cytosine-5)-methyltransferase 1